MVYTDNQSAKFCAGCGSKMGPPPSAVATGVSCPSCGNNNASGKFCAECGFALGQQPVKPPTCGCGVVKTTAKFCANCGEKWG